MKRLRITMFSDGRPGHEKQSLGIIRALRRYLPIDMVQIELVRRSFLQEIGSYIGYFLGMSVDYGMDGPVDLVIGTGSRTHIAVLSCARRENALAIVCMTPPWPLRDRFDLCCSPIHDRVQAAGNVFFTVGPPNNAEAGTDHNVNSGMICIGGVDPSSHIWDEKRIEADVRAVISKSTIPTWTISSSPRTPESTERLLAEVADELSGVCFVPFKNTASGWIENQYRLHKTVWITADSISMVYEALSAGCRVGVIPVRWKRRAGKFQFSEQYLIGKKLIVSLSAWLAQTACWQEIEPLDEADRCAREILKRWYPKSLP